MTTVVMVTVPDGVYEGQEFVLEYEGQQLTVCCPDGCGPGSDINLEVPTGDSSGSGEAPQNLVDVVVPDDCYEGMEFTVEFDGRSFNIAVPPGMGPGETVTIEVPPAEETPPTKSPAPQQQLPAESKPKPIATCMGARAKRRLSSRHNRR